MKLSVRQSCFPYCLQRQQSGNWVFLNRNYKPIGFNTLSHVDYLEHPVGQYFNIDENTKKLLDGGGSDDNAIYLYGDGSNPSLGGIHLESYLKKLGIIIGVGDK